MRISDWSSDVCSSDLAVACADEQCACRAIPAALSEDLPAPVRPGPLPHMRGQLAQYLALLVRNRQVAPVGGRLDAAGSSVNARAGLRSGVGRVLFPARPPAVQESNVISAGRWVGKDRSSTCNYSWSPHPQTKNTLHHS